MIKLSLQDMHKVIAIAKQAGEAIMEIYQRDFTVEYKEDQSPLTEADLASHHLICDELNRLYPDIPILSEESVDTFKLADENACFWCVDPLDGTKEFIKKNDEFTVNIALIQNQQAILGVIGVPAKDITYAAAQGEGAFKQEGENELLPIKVKPQDPASLTFAVSRSHLDEQTKKIVNKHQGNMLQAGSALKLAYVAEGLVDIYPRFGPTMLWDVAAGQCIIEEAGGKVLWAEKQQPMTYHIHHMKNDSFIAINESLQKRVMA
ncbi:MAG: 3'(2'),5'-bisphosphate nucleotidase CysQ [Nitrospina sp.]|jgi:3'(2'), 5'-bisphosphate nucleotidase|nr:3'(2'),5'-bisphosphate nucleotidase CysQ [Nitrospina sp.]